GAPVEVLRRVLDRLGFAPDVSTRSATGTVDLHLRACPFIELVHSYQEAMCGLHHGVIRGVLEGAGAAGGPARDGGGRAAGEAAARGGARPRRGTRAGGDAGPRPGAGGTG